MNKLLLFPLIIIGMLLTGCDKYDATNDVVKVSTLLLNDTLPSIINEDIDLVSGRNWYIHGYTYVANEATLTIQAGTIIRMIPATQRTITTFGAGLIITRGSKLVVEGNKYQPVVFEYASLLKEAIHPWYGIIMLGRRPLRTRPDTSVFIPALKTSFSYGGNLKYDSSGILKYVTFKCIDTTGILRHQPGLHLLGTSCRIEGGTVVTPENINNQYFLNVN